MLFFETQNASKFQAFIYINEPSHEIMVLFILRKLILQKCMHSHANSEGFGETAQMRRLIWAYAGRLCDEYHNLMSWLKS